MIKKISILLLLGTLFWSMGPLGQISISSAATATSYEAVPPFVTAGVPPLVMLVMGRNHKLYYEAYNDASDLDQDGTLDVGYNPTIDYYGYFDSFKCYNYSSGNRFEPAATTTNKTCNGNWSGDFLNYLTMSRMDTIRKVLYGGYRSTDTSTETVLERVFIPQDAHTWGKEYESVSRDGYDISDYTPLGTPSAGTRHLFASTTLSDTGDPLLRVLPNNTHRIWEWVAKERPVADNSLEVTGGGHPGHPSDHTDYDNMVLNYADTAHLFGTGLSTNGRIDGSGNPYGTDDNYLTIFSGSININTGGTYQFAVDGDDALEVIIDGVVVASWYNAHPDCNGCTTHNGTITLSAGLHTIEFRHEEAGGGDNYYLHWNGPDSGNIWTIVPSLAFDADGDGNSDLIQSTYDLSITTSSTITDYVVRVLVGDSSMPEANCKQYPSGVYKPIGILQRHGESDRMYFGLLTGSYDNNTDGGILRKNIGSINDEINPNTGQFTTLNGIIKTIDGLRIIDFRYSDHAYAPGWIGTGDPLYDPITNPGAWVTTRPANDGEFPDWGNPIGEMMYETLRYFAGNGSPTSGFTDQGNSFDSSLGLPAPGWIDPYDLNAGGFEECAKPFMLVLSDIYPTYDSDDLPGSAFSSFSGDLSGLDVGSLGDVIFTQESLTGNYFIGQQGANYDGGCTEKGLSGFGDIRGLCPEEPTKQGSYYSASVAYHGLTQDLNSANDDQKTTTYTVGLASPLPNIEIPVGNQTITLVPFAKTVGGCLSASGARGDFQATNTLVDFFVESIGPANGRFRINWEDVEQAADHDMDAIVIYEYQVVDGAGNPVTDPTAGTAVNITLTSEYASGCLDQHIGYIVSGTSADGTYLEVMDFDVGAGNDPDYFLDTPPGVGPNTGVGDTAWDDDVDLPLATTRQFTPGSGGTGSAELLQNPLYYAAKWGGFEDKNGNDIPDRDDEWDKDMDGLPDTYFYVVNPLKLEEQLNKSFADILRRTSSGTVASVISGSRSGEGAIYQSIFYPEYNDNFGNTSNWVGEVQSLFVDAYGNMREDSNHNRRIDLTVDKVIAYEGSNVYKFGDDDGNSIIEGAETTPDFIGSSSDINYLWKASSWLNEMSAANAVIQRSYGSTSQRRHIVTFIDADQDMIVDSGEQHDFEVSSLPSAADLSNSSEIYPYIPVHSDSTTLPAFVDATNLTEFLQNQTQRVVNYVRGADQPEFTLSTGDVVPAFRSRQVDYDADGTLETWRLGDIVYSSPTAVGKPQEALHFLYRDQTFAEFAEQYNNRRTVIYAGGNDGMLHAFNGGFYENRFDVNGDDEEDIEFLTQPKDRSGSTDTSIVSYALGSELWAYVPYNLLPHLYWLTETGYAHSYYADLKPRIFDAKIFTPDADHPNGWGTVLVGGMRFGGGKIDVDMNRTDGTTNASDRTMSSAFYVLDITNPENPPVVLAEITFPGLGYTTCYPTVIAMKEKYNNSPNDWYLVFGSGPAEADGSPGTNSGIALPEASSDQKAKLFVVDLVQLTQYNQIRTINSTGSFTNYSTTSGSGPYYYQEFSSDDDAFISDPITVDYDLDYKADAVYFGTVSGNATTGWGGKLRRVVIDNDANPTSWDGDSVLLDLESSQNQPITAAPTVGIDSEDRQWVFFGTGRYFVRNDANNTDNQTFYGVKEPIDSTSGDNTWAEVAHANLLDVTNIEVDVGGATTGGPATDFAGLTTYIESNNDGWKMDFTTLRERNVGQAALLGDILTLTSYMPSPNICQFEGESNFYALYFRTGTAADSSVIGSVYESDGIDNDGDTIVDEADEVGGRAFKKLSLGPGLVIRPSLHTGRQAGSTAFIQTSSGAIKPLEEKNPGQTKSGIVGWGQK